MKRITPKVSARTKAEAKVSPQASAGMQLLAYLLTRNNEELAKLVEQELEENPALELSEEITPPTEPLNVSITVLSGDESPISAEDSFNPQDEEPELPVCAPPLELKQHVWGQLQLVITPQEHPIAEFLVESLDEKGYLKTDVEEVALHFNCSLETVEAVLTKLHQCDPPGVGARNLQECLLLQLDALLNDPSWQSQHEWLLSVRKAIQIGWDEMSRAEWRKLASRLKVDEQTVEAMVRFIRNELYPYPSAGFEVAFSAEIVSSIPEPDIVVRLSKAGFEVEIRGYKSSHFRISSAYREALHTLRNGNRRAEKDEGEHLYHYLKRAQTFVQALQQREQTLRRIMNALVRYQQSFFFTGDGRFLQPMTRAQLAQLTRLHPSTVGRAVRNKWIQLPNGVIAPMEVFFNPAYRIALLIQQILNQYERPERPLTDAEIAHKLKEMGIQLARRTVSKYRARYNIYSSRWRGRMRIAG